MKTIKKQCRFEVFTAVVVLSVRTLLLIVTGISEAVSVTQPSGFGDHFVNLRTILGGVCS